MSSIQKIYHPYIDPIPNELFHEMFHRIFRSLKDILPYIHIDEAYEIMSIFYADLHLTLSQFTNRAYELGYSIRKSFILLNEDLLLLVLKSDIERVFVDFLFVPISSLASLFRLVLRKDLEKDAYKPQAYDTFESYLVYLIQSKPLFQDFETITFGKSTVLRHRPTFKRLISVKDQMRKGFDMRFSSSIIRAELQGLLPPTSKILLNDLLDLMSRTYQPKSFLFSGDPVTKLFEFLVHESNNVISFDETTNIIEFKYGCVGDLVPQESEMQLFRSDVSDFDPGYLKKLPDELAKWKTAAKVVVQMDFEEYKAVSSASRGTVGAVFKKSYGRSFEEDVVSLVLAFNGDSKVRSFEKKPEDLRKASYGIAKRFESVLPDSVLTDPTHQSFFPRKVPV